MKKQLLNQLINIVWTVLGFAPVLAYWISAGNEPWLYVLLAVSLGGGFLPASFFTRIQLSRDTRYYEKRGVKMIRKFVQNGDYVSNKKDAGRNILKNRIYYIRYLKTIDMYERYHFICLVFFFLTSLHAAFHAMFSIAILITVCNYLYNVCPLLLQQYNKVRIWRLSRNEC